MNKMQTINEVNRKRMVKQFVFRGENKNFRVGRGEFARHMEEIPSDGRRKKPAERYRLFSSALVQVPTTKVIHPTASLLGRERLGAKRIFYFLCPLKSQSVLIRKI